MPSKTKDLVVATGGDISHAVLVDNNKQSGLCHQENFIWVPDFVGQVDDLFNIETGPLFKHLIFELHNRLLNNQPPDVRCPGAKKFIQLWQRHAHYHPRPPPATCLRAADPQCGEEPMAS
mmetsp:Transcript_44520/g.110811  ORF Transcript_44520/g.110811 Transcript_44520/m.110811 type:complete len:120 (-) Transcript_44520:79-438(-)